MAREYLGATRHQAPVVLSPANLGEYATYAIHVPSITTRDLAARVEGNVLSYSGIARQKSSQGLKIPKHAEVTDKGTTFHFEGFQAMVAEAFLACRERLKFAYNPPASSENTVRYVPHAVD